MEEISINKIIDITWRLGVTVASSGSNEVGKNSLQLKLVYDEDGRKKSIFTEMNVHQFYKLLHDLEMVKSSLDILA